MIRVCFESRYVNSRYAMVPVITSEFSECPLGNDAEYSYGGTASESGGLDRPTRALPATVRSSEPAAAAAVRSRGVQLRCQRHSTATAAAARSGRPMVPPRFVSHVTEVSSTGERSSLASASTGWSKAATPSSCATAS